MNRSLWPWLWILLVLAHHRQLGNEILAAKLTPPGVMPQAPARSGR